MVLVLGEIPKESRPSEKTFVIFFGKKVTSKTFIKVLFQIIHDTANASKP